MGLVTLSPERATDPEILLPERVMGQESRLQEKVIGQVIQFPGTAMQQETHPKEKVMDLANHPEKAMGQETCPERAIVVLGKVTVQGTNQGQATVPGMLLLQEELTGRGQLRGRHMGQPLHIVDHLLKEEQDPHREDLMMQGPPRQGKHRLETSLIPTIFCEPKFRQLGHELFALPFSIDDSNNFCLFTLAKHHCNALNPFLPS